MPLAVTAALPMLFRGVPTLWSLVARLRDQSIVPKIMVGAPIRVPSVSGRADSVPFAVCLGRIYHSRVRRRNCGIAIGLALTARLK
jgi:hypothetical protein